MLSYFLILTAVMLFIGGLIFLIKGWRGSADEEVVPITDLEEIRALNVTYPGFEQKTKLAATVERAEALPTAETTQKVPSSAADQEVIAQLTHENNTLKSQMEEKQGELSRLAADIEAARQAYERLRSDEGSRLEDLQKNIARLEQEKEQLLLRKDEENSAKVEQWNKELAQARQVAVEHQAQLTAKMEQFQGENRQLQEQTEESQKEIQRLKANLELIHKVNNQKLNEANEAIRFLQIQKSESDRIQGEVLGKQLAEAMAKVGEFKREREELIQARSGLEEDLTTIKDFNSYLLEKEKILQYELTKQRAQALGLEKICEDFKVQIDEMAKSVVAKR